MGTTTAANENGRNARHQDWMRWRDISTCGSMRVLEVEWRDIAETRHLTILDFTSGLATTLVGPDLGDVELLALWFDVRRYDEGRGTLHFDPEEPAPDLIAALQREYARLAEVA